MKILIEKGHVIDPSQTLNTITSLAIENGKIAYIQDIPANWIPDKIIDAANRWVVPGFVDLCCRPHLQHPQGSTLHQEAKAALRSGVTSFCIPPDGQPLIDTPATVARLLSQSEVDLPHLYPFGALTTQLDGHTLADLTALHEAGCVAFTQAQSSMNNKRLIKQCYDYAASFAFPVIIQPCDSTLAKGGIAHEGYIATRLGLSGIPDIAETIAVAEHLLLIEKTGVRAHFTCLSTAKAVEQIALAKTQGLPVSADTAMHSLHLSEENLEGFNAHCHLYPPLRSIHDRASLRQGLQMKILDAICSDHRPLDAIAKLAPFGDTVPGMSSLDTFLALGISLIDDNILTPFELIQLLSTQPAALLNLPGGSLQVQKTADICIVDPTKVWKVTESALHSKGKNTPFKHQTLKGKVITTLLKGQIVYECTD